jgi:hypothetical protein
MSTYTWTILQMLVMPVLDGQTDVVVAANWNILGEDQGYSYNLAGWQQFTLQQGEGFTPYDQLTEAQVIGWVQDAMGEGTVASLEASVQGSLDALINPPVEPVIEPLPWSQA